MDWMRKMKTWLRRWMWRPMEFRAGEHHWLAGVAGSGKTRHTQRALQCLSNPTQIRVLVVTDHPDEWRIPWHDEHSLVVYPVDPRSVTAVEDYYEAIWSIITQRNYGIGMPILVIEGGDAAMERIAAAVSEIPGLTGYASIVLHTQSVKPLPPSLQRHFSTVTAFRIAGYESLEWLQSYAAAATERTLTAIMMQRRGAYVRIPLG